MLASDASLQNGTAVPGDSPVKYHNDDPGNDLFIIESLDVHPNPCVIESYSGVIIHGTFTESLVNTTPHVSFNVTSYFPDGREGLVPGEDDLCNWVDIIQQEEDDDDDDDETTTSSLTDAHYDTNDLAPDSQNPLLYRFKRNLQTQRKDVRSCPRKKGKSEYHVDDLNIRRLGARDEFHGGSKGDGEGETRGLQTWRCERGRGRDAVGFVDGVRVEV